MPSNCCSNGGACACLILAGDGINIAGSGSPSDGYIVSADFPDLVGSFTVQDTPTVNLSVTGGTGGNPLVLRADATISVTDLRDYSDVTPPVTGDVLTFVGSGSSGHWEAAPAPANPPGAVNTGPGIDGDGSSPDPIELAVSGTWGVAPLNVYGPDSTVGRPVYIDSAGQVRASPSAGAWNDITGKPTIFPTNAANVANQLDLNVGFIRGKRVFTDPTDTTGANAPTTGVSDGDVYFYRAP